MSGPFFQAPPKAEIRSTTSFQVLQSSRSTGLFPLFPWLVQAVQSAITGGGVKKEKAKAKAKAKAMNPNPQRNFQD